MATRVTHTDNVAPVGQPTSTARVNLPFPSRGTPIEHSIVWPLLEPVDWLAGTWLGRTYLAGLWKLPGKSSSPGTRGA